VPKVFTVTPKFKLIVEHLKAVRTLNDYVNGGLSEDMQALTNYLKQDLNRGILWPASWKDLNTPKGSKSDLHSSPATSTMNCFVPKWEVVEDDFIVSFRQACMKSAGHDC
jgi:hypothetical protein